MGPPAHPALLASSGVPAAKCAAPAVPDDERTTVLLRNLPSHFSRDAVAEVLDREGFEGRYDFVYVPSKFKTWVVIGHAFVNMVTPLDAQAAERHFQGLAWPGASGTICDANWSRSQQGLEALVERFRNSPVMHGSVPDAVRPAVYAAGLRTFFPPPTRWIEMPKV